jgi:hypothetical protein
MIGIPIKTESTLGGKPLRHRLLVILLAAQVLLAPAAVAQDDLSGASACIETSPAGGPPPAQCIAAVLQPCLVMPTDTPAAASLCFREANSAFSDAIRAEMQQLSSTAPERITAIAGIEVKYDLLMGLAQCDRLRDLALVGDADIAAIQLEDDRCRTVASGMTWMRLKMRSSDL